MCEYEQIRSELAEAKLGSYLIIPLKYEENEIDHKRLLQVGTLKPLVTMDLNESIKNTINSHDTANIFSRYEISAERMRDELFGADADAARQIFVYDKNRPVSAAPAEDCSFRLYSAYLYIFHTQVAFLCLGIIYPSMETLECICNFGFAESKAAYYIQNAAGEKVPFSLDERLDQFCARLGTRCFFRSGSSIFLECYPYNMALVPKYFRSLETIRQITFNMHLMTPLDRPAEDDSEEDLRYVYAVKDQSVGSYRWGCCVTSQTISYVIADAAMDIDREMFTQAEDGLPVILLALYQKYTCLRFTELLAIMDKVKIKRLRILRRKMLEFRAYGVIAPAHISRWHNVKRIYQHVIETNGIDTAVEDINNKLNILSDHQKELESQISDTVVGIVTVFGIVSILASVLTIVQILSGGTPLDWIVVLIFSVMVVSVVLLGIIQNKR